MKKKKIQHTCHRRSCCSLLWLSLWQLWLQYRMSLVTVSCLTVVTQQSTNVSSSSRTDLTHVGHTPVTAVSHLLCQTWTNTVNNILENLQLFTGTLTAGQQAELQSAAQSLSADSALMTEQQSNILKSLTLCLFIFYFNYLYLLLYTASSSPL